MAGFEYRGQLSGGKENPVTLPVLIGNSQTIKVGDAVKLVAFASGGGACRATTGEEVMGVCVGIVDKNGIDLDNSDPNNYDGTWTSSSKTYASSADNMSDKLVKALVVVDKDALWYNDTAGALAAADEYKFFDVADQDQIADQDGADNAGAFILVKRDPDGDADASKGIFKIAESEFDAYAQQ
jgi:hypothetical protein